MYKYMCIDANVCVDSLCNTVQFFSESHVCNSDVFIYCDAENFGEKKIKMGAVLISKLSLLC